MADIASVWVRALPRMAFALASAICALGSAVAAVTAPISVEVPFRLLLAVALGLLTVAASAFSERES